MGFRRSKRYVIQRLHITIGSDSENDNDTADEDEDGKNNKATNERLLNFNGSNDFLKGMKYRT